MSIRLRLTLWYTAIFFLALSVFAVVIYMGLDRSRSGALDNTISGRAREAAAQIRIQPIDRATAGAFVPAQAQLDNFISDGIYIQYVDTKGADQRRSSNLRNALALTPSDVDAIKRGQPLYQNVHSADGEPLRVYILPLSFQDIIFGAVVTAKSTVALDASLRTAQYLMAGGTVGATLLLGLIVYIVAAASLRPIRRMARDAAGIQQAQDLSRRVAVPQTGDEVADLGQTFNGMLGRLEAAFEAQRRFIADASHELRTPLTAIRGNADLLRYHDARMEPAERAEVLDEVATEAERMSRLVNDLLSLARAQTGEQIRPAPVRFDEAVDGAVRAARGLARGHEILYLPTSTPFWVMGDPDRMKQLALILLDNAVKYTPPEGHIWVAVRQDRSAVELRVVDDGPGIPAERLPHLFERFYRGGTLARGRDDGGAGLGLAIAREIVQGYGGTIAVASTVDQGTAFTVQFPLLPAASPATYADVPTASIPAPIASARPD